MMKMFSIIQLEVRQWKDVLKFVLRKFTVFLRSCLFVTY